jgi:hypothetical protein
MEEEGPPPAPASEALPTDPASLRALAELEEARSKGELTEAEYLRRKREILQGR